MENNLCLIISFFQKQRIETVVNMQYFKKAFYDSYSNDILLVLEFADFKIHHHCNKRINLYVLIKAFQGYEVNLQDLE